MPQVAFPVVWIAQRNDLLMTLFLLGGLILADRGVRLAGFAGYFLAYLCKGTCAFFPLAYLSEKGLGRSLRDRVIALVLIAAALPFAGQSVQNWGTALHLSGLGEGMIYANYAKNFVLSWLVWFIPLPYLGGWIAIASYLVCALTACRLMRSFGRLTPVTVGSLIIALTLSFTLVAQPEIRVTYLQSLFLVTAFVAAIEWREALRFGWWRKAAIAGAAGFLVYALPAASYTVDKLDSPAFDADTRVVDGVNYRADLIEGNSYPFEFYAWLREFQIGLQRKFDT